MNQMNQRTKEVIRLRNIYLFLSLIVWIGVAAFMICSVIYKITSGESTNNASGDDFQILTEQAKTFLLSIGTTAVVGIIASFIIKDKLRTFIWICSVVISAIIYGSVGMYIVLVLWLLEEYVLHNLYKYYANKVSINKEIDLRG